jgi:hypothetical protein
MVSHYLTIKLIGREHIPGRKTFHHHPMREVVVSGINHRFRWLSQSQGQITHVLLTRSPLEYHKVAFPLDLHVLSTPPAFVLSQDQTLHRKPNPQPKRATGISIRATSMTKNETDTLSESSSKKPRHQHPPTPKKEADEHKIDVNGAKQTNSSTNQTHC